jgi:hypothetical protein
MFALAKIKGMEDGWPELERLLANLVEHPEEIIRSRLRFSIPLSLYRSYTSCTTTRTATPLSEEERRLEDRRRKFRDAYEASLPEFQLHSQCLETAKHIDTEIGVNIDRAALERVKERWVEQGIWKNEWTFRAWGKWKHEEQIELESRSETPAEVGPKDSISPHPLKHQDGS